MKHQKKLLCALAASFALSLCACASTSNGTTPSTEASAVQPETQVSSVQTEATLPNHQFWDDVVELVNLAGETTTVYKLADGRYLDRMDRIFTYDGVTAWTCEDGSVWNRKADATAATTIVSAEFAIERFLAQRPDHLFFTEAAGNEYASKVVLSFDTPVTNFRFLRLEGQIDGEGEFVCSGLEVLYNQDLITENDLMVVETVLEGLVPNRGISFVDAGGNTRYYYLTVSGEDNVPLLIPFHQGGK